MRPRILFLGGNGHCPARLAPARAVLARGAAAGEAAFELLDPPLPGFEKRPRAPTLDVFLDALSAEVRSAIAAGPLTIYATGLGGLLALCLRARGEHGDVPLLLQAPVLWGLERRWMPRLMRLGLATLLQPLFAWAPFQTWFIRKQFERPLAPDMRDAFFQGYARCEAAADFFRWLTPRQLRILERRFAGRPDALGNVRLWWGERDRVVTLQEWEWTRAALKVDWPLRTFPSWGHYPMIDEPDAWVGAVADELAAAASIPRSEHSQAR